MTAIRWRQATNILCIRLDYLGDVLMMTPAIRALKNSLPGRRITLMTSAGGAAVAPFIPELDDVIGYAAPWMKSSAAHAPEVDFEMLRLLQSRRFDAVVIFTTYSQSPLPAALLCYLAGIPLRLAHCHENPYQLLTDWVRDPEPQERIRHEVRRQLDLVASVGCRTADEHLSFQVRAADIDWVRGRLQAFGVDTVQPWIVLHPGASASSRRYPAEHWAEVARQLAAREGCPLIFTGSPDEAALIETIRQAVPPSCSPSHTLAGQLDLGKLAALISMSPLLVANNTGPAHIAAAVGTPIVDLYALTNPQHTPWQVPNRVLFQDVPCRYCYKSVCPQGHHHCLTQVAPASVVAAADELMQGQLAGNSTTPPPEPAVAAPTPLPL
jgi:lipopolysaccharide heptosyltransferase II